jgi:soluble lytic murein transglycosylase-like protein
MEDSIWTHRFDGQFRKYSKRLFGVGFDWRWFKAQGIAESGLRPQAASGAGARGIMQLLPTTYQEIAGPNRAWLADIEEPRWNIAAGLLYDRYLYDLWENIDGEPLDRLAFTLASYNGGRRRTLRAQARCSAVDCDEWQAVAAYVPTESRNYVEKIMGLMGIE